MLVMSMRVCRALAFAVLVVAPGSGGAQDCTDCVLGLYADPQLTSTQALPEGPSVDIYLGIRYGTSISPELTGIEFSIAGLDSFTVVTQPLDDPPAVLGSPAAPAGIDSVYGQGGMNIAWGRCLTGDRALIKFTLTPRRTWPAGTALRVKRHYPPTNSSLPFPLLTRCDEPYYSAARVAGGTFVLGPAGTPVCSLTVPSRSFPLTAEGDKATLAFTMANVGAGVLDGLAGEDRDDFGFYGDYSYSLAHGQSKAFRLVFSPRRPGPQSCTVNLGSGCDTLEFTGRAPEIQSIASVYSGGDSLLGRKITVEGQVTVTPLNRYGPWYATGWVQDESGRGLPVTLPGTSKTQLHNRGNYVRASGTLVRSNGVICVAATGVTVLETGRPWVLPVALPAAQVAQPMWQGTLVEIEGRLEAGFPGELYYMHYHVRDSTGVAVVLAPERLPIGGSALACGAASGDSSGALFIGDPVQGFVLGPECGVRRIELGWAEGPVGSTITVPMSLFQNRGSVDSIRVRVGYDPRNVDFVNVSCSGLAAQWAPPAADTSQPNSVLVVAAGSPGIPAISEGEILRFTFEVTGCVPGASEVGVLEAGADLTDFALCPGRVVCADCPADGDLNEDGVLTPADARCAFEIFLAAETVPPECDMPGVCELPAADLTCDLVVTPADALGILRRWLAGDTTPRACVPSRSASLESSLASSSGRYFRLDDSRATRIGASEIDVPLEMCSLPGPGSFGADVYFDPERMEFVELRRAAAADGWAALKARQLDDGRVRVGGFVTDRDPGPALGNWIPLAHLVFRLHGDSVAPLHCEWLEQISGESESTVIPARFEMRGPRPNPVMRTGLFIDIAVPDRTDREVEVQVLDVRGRRVRSLFAGALAPGLHTLEWDCRDAHATRVAAGVYLLQARLGTNVVRRKLVVLE